MRLIRYSHYLIALFLVSLLSSSQGAMTKAQEEIDHYEKQLEWTSDIGAISAIEWSPNGQWIAAVSLQGMISIWNASDGSLLHSMQVYSGPLYSLDWDSYNLRIVTGGHDKTVRIWDAMEGREVCVLTGHRSHIGAGGAGIPTGVAIVKWNPNGDIVASGGYDGTVRLWPINTDCELIEPIVFPIAYSIPVLGLDWSAGGDQVMSIGGLDTLQIWNTRSVELQDEIACPIVHSENDSCRFLRAAWSPDSHYIMASSETAASGFTAIWNVDTLEHRYIDSVCVSGSEWMPQSNALLGWCDGELHIWDVESLELIGSAQFPQEQWQMIIRGGSSSVFAVAPDEKHIVMAYQTETQTVIQIWGVVR